MARADWCRSAGSCRVAPPSLTTNFIDGAPRRGLRRGRESAQAEDAKGIREWRDGELLREGHYGFRES